MEKKNGDVQRGGPAKRNGVLESAIIGQQCFLDETTLQINRLPGFGALCHQRLAGGAASLIPVWHLMYLFIILAIAAVASVVSFGFSKEAIILFCYLAACFSFVWYFESRRSRKKETSFFEKALATLWLFIRRAVGFLAAALFFSGALNATGLFSSQPDGIPLGSRILGALAMFFMSFCCVWLAILGRGYNRRTPLKDDMQRHAENKKRYKWRL